MRSRILWTVVFLLLIAAMLAPLAEGFDRWDSAPGLGQDTEFQVAALALLGGLCAVVVLTIARAAARVSWVRFARVAAGVRLPLDVILARVPADCSPPPLQLRV